MSLKLQSCYIDFEMAPLVYHEKWIILVVGSGNTLVYNP